MDTVKIQLTFTIEEDGLLYTDALYFTQHEFDQLKDSELESMKQDRFKKFKKALADAKNTPPPSDEELLSDIDMQLEQLNKRKEELSHAKPAKEKLAEIDQKLTELSEKRQEVEPQVSSKPIKNASVEFHKGGSQ